MGKEKEEEQIDHESSTKGSPIHHRDLTYVTSHKSTYKACQKLLSQGLTKDWFPYIRESGECADNTK